MNDRVQRPRGRPRRPAPIAMEELQALIMDPAVPERELRPYLEMDPVQSRAFAPTVRVRTEMVSGPVAESAFALSGLNGIARWRRQQEYRRRRPDWDGPVAVSEGDSWFQFPFLLDDVIDQLHDDYAIFSLDAAGDLLSDIVRQDELAAAIRTEKPHIVFLSGGGNDLLGSGRLAAVLKQFEDGDGPEDLVTGEFDAVLRRVIDQYGEVFESALSAGAPRIVCHCYDYAIPDGGRWLGRPMEARGIEDARLQRDVIELLIDRFRDALVELARRREFAGTVVLADTRGAVAAGEWWDELHPGNDGFAAAARRIKAAAERPPEEARRRTVRAEASVRGADDPYAAHSDAVLHAEIGRRIQMMRTDPEAAARVDEIGVAIEEGLFQPLFLTGRRVVDRLGREVFDIVCGAGPDDAADRERLQQALRLDTASVIGALTSILVGIGVSTAVAPLVAVAVWRLGIGPTVGELCELWGDALGERRTA